MAVVEFVNALGTWVEESLLKRFHKAPFFSIMADECTDVTTIEELTICYRVESGVPKEHFIEITCSNLANALGLARYWMVIVLSIIEITCTKLQSWIYLHYNYNNTISKVQSTDITLPLKKANAESIYSALVEYCREKIIRVGRLTGMGLMELLLSLVTKQEFKEVERALTSCIVCRISLSCPSTGFFASC